MQAVESGGAALLQQAHRNNWQKYLESLKPDAPAGWDLCVLTASSEQQAAMYRRQLVLRREAGLLPSQTSFLVIADPAGRRIGSGGATLRVLAMLDSRATGSACVAGSDVPPDVSLKADLLTTGRVLIIHSGGDSRRLPHCSVMGKLFARIPHALPDGRASTVFDSFLISLSALAGESPPGVLIASGDVLLIFDHLQLQFQRPGVIGVAAAAPQEMGTRHGVYVSDGGRRLRAYLHKPAIERMEQWDAIAPDGVVAIDTGLVWLDAPTVRKFVELVEQDKVGVFCGPQPSGYQPSGRQPDGRQPSGRQPDARQPSVGLNLYGDLLMPLAESTTWDGYLADTSDGLDTPAVKSARRVIWDRLRGVPFAVERLQPAVFVHFGSSREYWKMVADSPDLAQTCGWPCHTSSWTSSSVREEGRGLALINSVVEGGAAVLSRQGLLIDSHVAEPLILHGAALIANLVTARSLTLSADVVLQQLPVTGGFVTRIYGLHDNPKHLWDDPGATFMNRPWQEWLDGTGIEAKAVWPGVPVDERTLWNARLYPMVVDREESLALSLPMQDPGNASSDWRAQWQACRRLSLAESFAVADGDRILAEVASIEDLVASRRFYSAFEAERPAEDIEPLLGSVAGAVERRAGQVAERLAADDPILRLRGYKALAEATGEQKWEDRAFETLAVMIEEAVAGQRAALGFGAGTGGQWASDSRPVRVEAAARIDFGGGWTDTPPYSIERGGDVLNAAVTLHGRYPIVVEAERLPEPRLVLESRDIGAAIEPKTVGDVLSYANPADPFALLKAAVVLRGAVPAGGEPDGLLVEALRESGGVRLSTQTTIPRGSGLGTSSILAGAVLACLAQLLGVNVDQARLFDEVLCLEQMLTTGGGWQDQVGGLVGGIKLVTTKPGLPQKIQVSPVQMSPETQAELADRLRLVYTGQQRLAKNLLRAVMGRWMARDPEMVWIQKEIARLAEAMRDALESGDLDQFGALLTEHWVLNKRMDPGCTNPFIDGLFEMMNPYIDGGKLAGAGGGGFAIVVARDRGAARGLASALESTYSGTPVAIWPTTIPKEGVVCWVKGSVF
jgi:fucokinase